MSKILNTIVNYIVVMATTIQISNELLEELKKRKLYNKETYEEIIWDLLEDTMELSEETLKNIQQAEKEIKAGKTHSLEEVEKECE
jgi:predicted transcriptional regulator